MEFTYSRKSKGTLKGLQQKFHEIQEKEMEEKRIKKLEYDRKHGFKSLEEILDYLQQGGVIGDYDGLWGERHMTNNFMVWKDGEIIRRVQCSSGNDANFWMETYAWEMDDFKMWLSKMDEHKNEEGYYNTSFLYKNFDITINDIDERLI